MGGAEIMAVLVLSHSGGSRCPMHYYKGYACLHPVYLFPERVSYDRFAGLEKEALFPLAIFVKEVLPGGYMGISLADPVSLTRLP